MKIKSITQPVYSKPDNSTVNCMIELEDGRILPFTASPDDVEPYGREIHALLVAGECGPISPYVPRPERPTKPANDVVQAPPNVVA
jgi:hypothetical protein